MQDDQKLKSYRREVKDMKRKYLLKTAISSLILGLSATGVAMAQDASLENTGPDSTNEIKIEHKNTVDIKNTNNIEVKNNVDQDATSGNATVSRNTNGGDASTGNASNESSVETNININNESAGSGSGGGGNGGGGNGAGAGGGGSGAGAGGAGAGAGGGVGGASGLGSGVGGAGMLPETGPEFPIDVSALRNAYGAGNGESAVQNARRLSAGLLGLAALLSLAGAAGSAVYAKRRSQV